jgi:predicted transcriptional regulator
VTPALVFPIEHDLSWMRRLPPAASDRSLVALLGRTRTFILTTTAAGFCTTTQLAHRAGVSIASASQHATVLRDTGLITSRRQGSCVIHAITPLGTTLIRGHPGPSPGVHTSDGLGDRR